MCVMKRVVISLLFLIITVTSNAWGFFGHRLINRHAVFLLPPDMLIFYKKNIEFLAEHAVDPDKRRYIVVEEGPRHYIDLDRYGSFPFDSLPRKWNDAVAKFSVDSLNKHGIVPWWIQVMLSRLTKAFAEKNGPAILKLSAEIGHYIADAHVPLHTSSNHNGQHTNQHGIHGFWESRIPELLSPSWDFIITRAEYIDRPFQFTWDRVLESAAASDTVLKFEKILSEKFREDRKYAFEERNGILTRTYSSAFTKAYDRSMQGMVERRMQQSIYAVASFWYTAWVNAGQPDLSAIAHVDFNQKEKEEFEKMRNISREDH